LFFYILELEYFVNSVGEGSIILNELVNKEERVSSIHIVRDLASLTSPTMDAVQQWKFAPGKHEGDPVECGVIIVVTFRQPAIASRTLHEENGRGTCGVSMKGHYLFRQENLHLAGA